MRKPLDCLGCERGRTTTTLGEVHLKGLVLCDEAGVSHSFVFSLSGQAGKIIGNRSVLNSMHLNKKMCFPACLLLSCIHALTTGERYSTWGQGTREDKNVSCSGSFCSFCMSLVFVGLSPRQDGQLGGITVLFKDCISINREVLEATCIAASHDGSQ